MNQIHPTSVPVVEKRLNGDAAKWEGLCGSKVPFPDKWWETTRKE